MIVSVLNDAESNNSAKHPKEPDNANHRKRMLDRLIFAGRRIDVHKMGKGYTMATALALEKLGLVIVENCNMDNGGFNPPFWGVTAIKPVEKNLERISMATATTTTVTTPVKAAAKKTAKKAVASATPAKVETPKTPVKAAAKKAATKVETKVIVPEKTAPVATTKEKGGLKKPQIRILKALSDPQVTSPLSRAQISEAGSVDVAMMVEYIGSHDDSRREANDAKHFPSLITLGFVKAEVCEGVKGIAYAITANGRKEAAKHE